MLSRTPITIAGLPLFRICPGLYETRDGEWTIEQGQPGCSWSGEWIFANSTMHGANRTVSDPVPTLREAAEQVKSSVEAAR